MTLDYKNMDFDIIDVPSYVGPFMFLNRTSITFSKAMLEIMDYPSHVQIMVSSDMKVFAIHTCKATDKKAYSFSRPKAEQTYTLSTKSQTLLGLLKKMIKNYDEEKRYKFVGEYDADSKTMFFEPLKAECSYWCSETKK